MVWRAEVTQVWGGLRLGRGSCGVVREADGSAASCSRGSLSSMPLRETLDSGDLVCWPISSPHDGSVDMGALSFPRGVQSKVEH